MSQACYFNFANSLLGSKFREGGELNSFFGQDFGEKNLTSMVKRNWKVLWFLAPSIVLWYRVTEGGQMGLNLDWLGEWAMIILLCCETLLYQIGRQLSKSSYQFSWIWLKQQTVVTMTLYISQYVRQIVLFPEILIFMST